MSQTFLFVAALSLVRADATKLDATWMNYLNNPPAAATQAATTLGNRADAIVAALKWTMPWQEGRARLLTLAAAATSMLTGLAHAWCSAVWLRRQT